MRGDSQAVKNMQISKQQELQLEQQIELLGSNDPRIRRAAYDALSRQAKAALEVVFKGLSHSNARVRRWCAEFIDHHGDDRCVEALCEALHDSVPYVRRQAVRSLSCQRCKSEPLKVDTVAYLIECALSDTNMRVRREAVYDLSLQPQDVRAISALETILRQESDRTLVRHAERALKHHDEDYRKGAIERAKARVLHEFNA